MAERELVLVSSEGDRLPAVAPFHNEGRTPAGWLVCWGLMLAALVVGIGLVAAIPAVTIAGAVTGVLTLVAGGAMRAAGLGQPHPSTTR